MSTAFFGGSFNPIHNGHLAIIKELVKEVDEVLVVPCGNHAFGKELLDSKKRTELIQLSIRGIRNVKISDIEIKSDVKSYTANTLRKLRESSDEKYYLVIGADNIETLDKWHDFTYLKNEVEFIIFKRPGYSIENIHNIKIKHIIELNNTISSSEIRERIRNNQNLEGLMPPTVIDYIKQEGLYI